MKTIKILAGIFFITILYIALGIIPIKFKSDSAKNFYEKSKKIKQGMTLNKVLKIMDGQPTAMHDFENKANDTSLRLEIIYWDPNNGGNEIRISFNDYLLVANISVSD